METKKETIDLWKVMYGPWPKKKQQPDLPGPLFDLTVVALGLVGAMSYLVSNHMR
jgi:hypothetical protein